MAQITQLQSTNTLGTDDQAILRQGTVDKRISLELAGTLSWAKRNGFTHIGSHVQGLSFTSTEDFSTSQGKVYFVQDIVSLPYTSVTVDPSVDNNLYVKEEDSLKYEIYKPNHLRNPNFTEPAQGVVIDATPKNFNPEDSIFSSWKALTAIVGATFVNNEWSRVSGSIYQDIPRKGTTLEQITEFTASIKSANTIPTKTGITWSVVGDNYRVVVDASDVFSVWFNEGSFTASHAADSLFDTYGHPSMGVFDIRAFGVIGNGVHDDTQYLKNAIDAAAKCGGHVTGAKHLNLLLTSQVTVKHGVSVDLMNGDVSFVHNGSLNDSPFQMGNNTELANISKVTYRSTSTTPFSTLGLVKVGEFYARSNGNISSGENSFDDTYWEVENVKVCNITSSAEGLLTATDRGYGSTVFLTGGVNVKLDTITNHGLASDGGLAQQCASTVRTETGYDTNNRRQGYNLVVSNISGFDLYPHTEEAIVYINGDMNTKVLNVYGERVAQLLGIGTNGSDNNQSTELRGKNGVNLSAENISGTELRIPNGMVFTHSLGALNIKGWDSVDLDGLRTNKTKITVKGFYASSIETEDAQWSKVPLGITIGDTGTYTGLIQNIKRVEVDDFECYWFLEGMRENAAAEGCKYTRGYLHHNENTGATLAGKGCEYNIKSSNNNMAGATVVGYNTNGFSLSCKRGRMMSCTVGDEYLAEGSETQLSGITVTQNDTTVFIDGLFIANYQSGYNDIGKRTAVTLEPEKVYIDRSIRGVRPVASSYPIAPDVATIQANVVNGNTGETGVSYNCSVTRRDTGDYTITFDQPFANTNYIISMTSYGTSESETIANFYTKDVASVRLYLSNEAGVNVDGQFDLLIFGSYANMI